MKSNLQLILAAFIWGCAFVAQSVGMDYVGPWTFNCLRFLLGSLTLAVLMPLLDRFRGIVNGRFDSETLRGGILCGAVLAAASMVQQVGIMYTTVGKAGFITALYVIIVPVLASFLGRKVPVRIWISVIAAAAGLYLLSVTKDEHIAPGDLIIFGCAVLFAVHILAIDRVGPRCDPVRLSCVQFMTAGALCLLPSLFIEKPSVSAAMAAWLPVGYAGILSCGTAYTLQIIGQRDADPSVASILLSLESVFSVLAGLVLLHQVLSLRELAGCAVMFAAILFAQKNDG